MPFDPQPGFDFKPLSNWPPQFSIYADCNDLDCRHSGKLDRGWLIEKYGDGLLIGDLKRMLKCGKCGNDSVRIMFVWNVYYQATDPTGSGSAAPGA